MSGLARDDCQDQACANEPVGRKDAGRFVAGTHARRHGTELRGREGIGLTKTDPAFFDAVILAKKGKPKLPLFISARRRRAY
jgi:hypothetical protein